MATRATSTPMLRLDRARKRATVAADRIEAVSPLRVFAIFVVAEWVAILMTGLVVRHSGWVYYQGGDQLWTYTPGWLLAHGELTQTPIGYLWSAMLAPIARIAGPNLVSAFPPIIVLNVLLLVPAAMLAIYGIAARIGGRIFGYWVLLLWLVVPFIGIMYTNPGYHQRYTELLLPQTFGLTGMADFPTTVFALISVYFCTRLILDERPALVDGIAAGAAAGAAIAVKPGSALFLVGPALAFAWTRRATAAAWFLAGIAPFVLTLAVWKERGLGNVPLLNGSERPGGLAADAPVAGLNPGKYFQSLDYDRLTNNIDLLREHFWSGRLIIWLLLAGLVGLARRSPRMAVLVGGWFFAFAFVKGSYTGASIEDGSFFRIMMPSYPAFILLLASVPLLLPHAPSRLREWRPAFRSPSPRVRWSLLGAFVLATSVIPLAAIAAASTGPADDRATLNATPMPVPSNRDLGLTASVRGRRVDLAWRGSSPLGGPVFYRVWRSSTDGQTCSAGAGAMLCNVNMPEVGVTRQPAFVDKAPKGHWFYRVAVGANWLNDPQYGDPYLVSRPVAVTIK